MELSTLWFILVAVLFTGFFILEGFDFGVGMLTALLGRNEQERGLLLKSIGPHWDGNEVWLLTAGGAIFAAFPLWYATLFSTLYLPFLLLLVALILRGIAIEYRNKLESPQWRLRWDRCIQIGSLLAALLVGVAITDLLHGFPLDAKGVFQGNFLDLVQPFPLLGGLTSLAVFLWIGLLFLQLKLSGEPLQRTLDFAAKFRWVAFILLIALGLVGFGTNAALQQSGLVHKAIAIFAGVFLLLSIILHRRACGFAFAAAALSIACTSAAAFSCLFPYVMISTLDPAWSITAAQASSTPYTLKIMTGVAALMVPLVLAYQGWTYWIFRKRLSPADKGGY